MQSHPHRYRQLRPPPDHDHVDITRSQVLIVLSEEVLNVSSRDTALESMTRALTTTLARLYAEGIIAGVISAGGSGNTSVCAAAFRDAFLIGFFQSSWCPPCRQETLSTMLERQT